MPVLKNETLKEFCEYIEEHIKQLIGKQANAYQAARYAFGVDESFFEPIFRQPTDSMIEFETVTRIERYIDFLGTQKVVVNIKIGFTEVDLCDPTVRSNIRIKAISEVNRLFNKRDTINSTRPTRNAIANMTGVSIGLIDRMVGSVEKCEGITLLSCLRVYSKLIDPIKFPPISRVSVKPFERIESMAANSAA